MKYILKTIPTRTQKNVPRDADVLENNNNNDDDDGLGLGKGLTSSLELVQSMNNREKWKPTVASIEMHGT